MTRKRNPDADRPDNDELSNQQPELAAEQNDTPRRTGNDSVYEPGEGAAPDDVDQAEDTGQQVIGELRGRKN